MRKTVRDAFRPGYRPAVFFLCVLAAPAPRRVAGLTGFRTRWPLGAIWRGTRLRLPPEAGSRAWSHLHTGAAVRQAVKKGKAWLDLSDVFRDFPVAFLTQ